jgi:hypothetical protein
MTYHELTRHPETLEALLLQARRERAHAVYRLIVLPLRRLLRTQACSKTGFSRENASSSRAAVQA